MPLSKTITAFVVGTTVTTALLFSTASQANPSGWSGGSSVITGNLTHGSSAYRQPKVSATSEMNNAELVEAIAKNARLSKADAKRALEETPRKRSGTHRWNSLPGGAGYFGISKP